MKPEPRAAILLCCLLTNLTACSIRQPEGELQTSPEASDADLYVKLGTQYLERGNFDVALQNLQKALHKDPHNSSAHNTIGVLYEQLERPALARKHFQKAVQLRPSDASAQNNFGRFLCGRGEYTEAQTHFKQAYENPLNPHQHLALTNAGSCALSQDDRPQAEYYLRKALRQVPKFSPALKAMARLSVQTRNFHSARAFLQRYQAVAKETAETLWLGVQTEMALGDHQAARRLRRQLLTQFAKSDEARLARERTPDSKP